MSFEELAFRALPLRYARPGRSLGWVVAVSLVVFGLVHMVNLPATRSLADTLGQSISAVGFGFIFFALYLRQRHLLPCVLLHGLINFKMHYRSFLTGHVPGVRSGAWDWSLNESVAFLVVACLIMVWMALSILPKGWARTRVQLTTDYADVARIFPRDNSASDGFLPLWGLGGQNRRRRNRLQHSPCTKHQL